MGEGAYRWTDSNIGELELGDGEGVDGGDDGADSPTLTGLVDDEASS